jgi:hypothetical protein
MSEDSLDALLGGLVDAYRAETADRDRDARALRARVLAGARAHRRSFRHHTWLMPLMATLVGSAALAATGGGGVRPLSRLLALLESHPSAPKVLPVTGRKSTRELVGEPTVASSPPVVVAVPAAPVASAGVSVVPLSALPVDEALVPRPEHVRRVQVTAPGAAARPLVADERELGGELTLYERAHALHFGGGTPLAALRGWRSYLNEYPSGALSAEARFNEAVCLLKLGRAAEARPLLKALAAGPVAPSVQSQAREVLAGLGK